MGGEVVHFVFFSPRNTFGRRRAWLNGEQKRRRRGRKNILGMRFVDGLFGVSFYLLAGIWFSVKGGQGTELFVYTLDREGYSHLNRSRFRSGMKDGVS